MDMHAIPRLAFCAAINQQTDIDWFRVITELRGRGHSLASIGKYIDAPASTVQMWADGQSPGFCYGALLLNMWGEVMSVPPLMRRIRRRRH